MLPCGPRYVQALPEPEASTWHERRVARLQEYKATLGITGVSLSVNPGGQIPYKRVLHSIHLLMDQVAPHVG